MMFALVLSIYLTQGLLASAQSFSPPTTTSTTTTWTEASTNIPEDAYRTAYACENQVLNIACSESEEQVLEIIRANFGRFSIAICNQEGRTDFSVNCLSPYTLQVLQQRCDGKKSCSALANATDFPQNGGDPCPTTKKYLEAHFYCRHTAAKSLGSELYLQTTQGTPTTSTRKLPPWMSSAAAVVVTEEPFSSSSSIEEISTTTTEKEKRIPITPKPKTTHGDLATTNSLQTGNEKQQEKKKSSLSEITTKFLSSSMASTNIMDTSEVPVTIINSSGEEVKKIDDDPTKKSFKKKAKKKTTLNTPLTTKKSVIKTTPMTVIAIEPEAPLHVVSNQPYPELDVDKKKCHPGLGGGLFWNWTVAHTTASVGCGPNAAGLAHWTCGSDGQWATAQPDLSQCQSYWLQKLRDQLDKQTSIVHVANDLAHYTSMYSPLAPGDLLLLIGTIQTMTDRMRKDLRTIPTVDQRRAVVTEVVQGIVKTTSLALDPVANGVAWDRLGEPSKRRKCLTLFIGTLEDAGLLLPEVVHENQEVTVASPNILMSVKGVNFGHMSRMKLPSDAAVASKHWSDYRDLADIPSLDLMEHMQQGGDAQIIFLSFKNLRDILPGPLTKQQKQDQRLSRLSSHVLSLTMGEKWSARRGGGVRALGAARLHKPITITFGHREEALSTLEPVCSVWDPKTHRWSSQGCHLLDTNQTHSQCACLRLGTFALLAPSRGKEAVEKESHHGPLVALLVVSVVIVVIVVAVVFIVAAICWCHKKNGTILWHKRLQASPELKSSRGQPCVQLLHSYLLCCCKKSEKDNNTTASSRSNSFAPSPFYVPNDRFYEMDDNNSVMTTTTPTFAVRPHRGEEVHIGGGMRPQHNTMMHRQVLHSPMQEFTPTWNDRQRQQPATNARRGLTLNLPRTFLPSKDSVATPERPLLTDFGSPDYNPGHIYMEVAEQPPRDVAIQPIHRPLQLQQLHEASCSSSSSGYGSNNGRYDNVRGVQRGPFVCYPQESVHYRRPIDFVGVNRKSEVCMQDSQVI